MEAIIRAGIFPGYQVSSQAYLLRSLQAISNKHHLKVWCFSHCSLICFWNTVLQSQLEGRVKSHLSSQSNWDFLWELLSAGLLIRLFHSQMAGKTFSGTSHVWCAKQTPMLLPCWICGEGSTTTAGTGEGFATLPWPNYDILPCC